MIDKLLIFTLVFVFSVYIFGTFTFDEDLWLFVQVSLVSIIIITISLSISLSLYFRKKYIQYTIKYIFLTVALTSYGIAEILWGYFEYINYTQYPSIADLFYVLYYLFLILFCVSILYKQYSLIPTRIKVIGFGTGLLYMYTYTLSAINLFNSDIFLYDTFLYSIPFMVLGSIVISCSIVTTLFVTNLNHFKNIWRILVFAFMINGVADIFYYSSENISNFEYTDLTNILWIVMLLLMIYGLNKNRYVFVK